MLTFRSEQWIFFESLSLGNTFEKLAVLNMLIHYHNKTFQWIFFSYIYSNDLCVLFRRVNFPFFDSCPEQRSRRVAGSGQRAAGCCGCVSAIVRERGAAGVDTSLLRAAMDFSDCQTDGWMDGRTDGLSRPQPGIQILFCVPRTLENAEYLTCPIEILYSVYLNLHTVRSLMKISQEKFLSGPSRISQNLTASSFQLRAD